MIGTAAAGARGHDMQDPHQARGNIGRRSGGPSRARLTAIARPPVRRLPRQQAAAPVAGSVAIAAGGKGDSKGIICGHSPTHPHRQCSAALGQPLRRSPPGLALHRVH